MNRQSRQTLFSSKAEDYGTPIPLYMELHKAFKFRYDPCTTQDNPLGTEVFYTKIEDGLRQRWLDATFVNMPYSVIIDGKRKRVVDEWVRKAHKESKMGITVVVLVAARIDTVIWQVLCFKRANAICFIKGRLHFNGDSDNGAPFPSAIVIFSPKKLSKAALTVLDRLGKTFVLDDRRHYVTSPELGVRTYEPV